MIYYRQLSATVLLFVIFAGMTVPASAQEPQWVPVVIARGEFRRQIEATPIELRPNRPLHFYGNTVRRMHYRGSAVPRSQDFAATGRSLVRAGRN